ncbi:hypothetical protein CCH79_00020548, partial [Gambusia affinis]
MRCNGQTDQFDNLEKHTSWGIDFLERYTKFVKERADIELSYAKQISRPSVSPLTLTLTPTPTPSVCRSLSKKFHLKRSREDDSRFTWCVAFAATLQQLNDMAAQREDLADCLHTQIACDLTRYTQELKAERKTVSRGPSCGSGGHSRMNGRRAQQHIENSWKQLDSSKRRFERDCKEAERAQHISDRIELDNKADGEKARQAAQQKQQAAEESRKEYVTSLNQFNQDQHQHYRTLVPVIYQLSARSQFSFLLPVFQMAVHVEEFERNGFLGSLARCQQLKLRLHHRSTAPFSSPLWDTGAFW